MSLTITIPGAVNVTTGSFAPAVLTIGVGVPGAQGPQGPAGQGVPVGGTAGQFLTKIDGTNYNTDWTTLNLSAYLTKAGNLSGLTDLFAARDNLQLGALYTPTFAGVTAQGSGSNVANLTPTSLTLTQTGYGYFTIQPSQGIRFPDTSVQTTAFPTGSNVPTGGTTGQSLVKSSNSNYAMTWSTVAGQPTSGTVGQVLMKNSGADYDSSWSTLIPGDRYVTTSTTSNTIGNGAKTFTVGTGLSYSSQQDVVISFDASNHMHAVVTSYDSGTGVLVVDVRSHTGSGTYTSWTVNVGGTTPLQTVEWGEILGTLGDQTDLASALNAKLETSTAASTYAALAGATFTGEVVTPASTTSSAGLMITPGVAPSAPVNGEIWATTNDLQVRLNGVTETIAEQSWVTAQGYLTSAPVTSVAGRTGAITLAVGDVSGAAALAGATFTGLVNTLASWTGGAGFRLPHGSAPSAPVDGDVWTTTGNLWVRINGASQAVALQGSSAQLSSNNIFTNASSTYGNSTAAGTINLGTGATISGATKAINIGTAGVSGSTTNITLGSAVSGALGTTTVNGNITATGTTLTLGNSTAASTINVGTGATLTATTKAVNIGTNGVAGSTTNIVVGSTTGTSTTTLQGTTNGVTVAADTNSTALATTAYVVGQAGSATPLVDGTAAVGTSLRYARQDHVHPTDTTRAPLASPAFTGTPSLPTGTTAVTQSAGNNTTAVATTAFVQQEVPAASTTAAGKVELATVDEALKPVSSTLGMTPETTREMLMYPGYLNLYGGGIASTSGTGASSSFTFATQRWHELVGPNTGIAGYASYTFDSTFSGVGMVGMTRGVGSYLRKWNCRIWASGRSMINAEAGGFAGDANTFARVMVGGRSSLGAGGMIAGENGIGWKVAGGGSASLVLTVSNGTTLTETTSSFTPTGSQIFDWKIYSDGTGNVTLWVNDSQVATSTGGPTTSTAEQYNFYYEVVDQTASAAARFSLYNFGSKVFWSQP